MNDNITESWFESVGRFYVANGDIESACKHSYEDGARDVILSMMPLFIAARDNVRQDAAGRATLESIIKLADAYK